MTTFIVVVIAWILIGGITGAFASQRVPSHKFGIWSDCIVGSVGGIVGGFIPRLVGISSTSVLTLVTAFLGAVLLLWIVAASERARKRQ
jgi:uncharacterized membrane protein YeaQ/YmgE (transglycosylase-associated protein family)